MNAPAETAKTVLPYVPYSTFLTVIDDLAATVVPTSVDSHVLAKLSGSARKKLLPALRYLDLIGDGATTTEVLAVLVGARKAGGEQWQKALRVLLDKAYAGILAKVNLKQGTAGELRTALRASTGDVSTTDDSMRFLISALKDAGVEISPHISKPGPGPGLKSSVAKKKKVAAEKPASPTDSATGSTGKAKTASEDHAADGDREAPRGFSRLPIPGRPREVYIQYPDDLTETDCLLFTAQIATLRVLLKARSEKGGPE